MTRDDAIAEVLRAASVFLRGGQVTELRALNVRRDGYRRPHTEAGWFNDWRRLAEAAAELTSRSEGVYFIPNPVNPALLARCANRVKPIDDGTPLTTDRDILARRWLIVDCDPVRPAKVSATDAEHDAALRRAREIRDDLVSAGWPQPVLADSGNGAHLAYLIDLPVDDGGLVKRVLLALALRYDDDAVRIDTSLHEPSQLLRAYGTESHKGDNFQGDTLLPARPHRVARLLEVPERLDPVPRELLEALAATVPEPPEISTPTGRASGKAFNLERWIADHNLDVIGPSGWGDGKRWVFRVCPWNPAHTNRSAYIVQFRDGAVAAGCHHNSCQGRDWHALRDLVEPGWREAARERRERAAEPPAPPDDTLPAIVVNVRQLRDHVAEAWAAVKAANSGAVPKWYEHGGGVTEVLLGDDDIRITPLGLNEWHHVLARVANWYQRSGERYKPVAPPDRLARDMLADRQPPLPKMTGILYGPTFTPDGRLLAVPGYDPQTGLLLIRRPGDTWPVVPERPTAGQVEEAKRLLLVEWLGDFPFADEASKAHIIGQLIAVVARPLIDGRIPGLAIDAASPSTGKGLLAGTFSLIAIGQPPTHVDYVPDDEEFEKRLASALRKAPAIVWLDNVITTLRSAALARVMTMTPWEPRVLGENRTFSFDIRQLFIVVGNNLRLTDEISRRFVWVRMEAPSDAPWFDDRAFRHPELDKWVREHRAELLGAALTLVTHWLASGRPLGDYRLGSFETWSRVIGGVLGNAEIPGFLTNVKEQTDVLDPEREEWLAFVAAWWDRFGGQEVPVSALLDMALEAGLLPSILAADGKDAKTLARRLGLALRDRKGRVFGGRRIKKGQLDAHTKAGTWFLEPVTVAQPEKTDEARTLNAALDAELRQAAGVTVEEGEDGFVIRDAA